MRPPIDTPSGAALEDALRAENAALKAKIAEAGKGPLSLESFFVAECYENELSRAQAEIDALKGRIEDYRTLVEAMDELLDARAEEMSAAVAHDDYHTGGKVHTEGRLEDARARVLTACDRAANARARVEAWEAKEGEGNE